MKRRGPPHPGEVILRKYLLPRGFSCRQLSRAMDVVNGRIANLLKGRADLNAELALRLSKVLGKSARGWLTIQATYDLWTTKATIDLSEVMRIDKSVGYWLRLHRPRTSPPPAGRRPRIHRHR